MLQAVVLGLVQGLTEFLPVSSSGHLVVVPYLVPEWESPGVAVDVALHTGTLLALVVYFAGDLWYLVSRSLGVGLTSRDEAGRARRTVALLAVASVPAALAGFLLEDVFAGTFERPRIVAGFFVVTAGLLYGAELLRRRRARRELGPGADADAMARADEVGRDETTVGWIDATTLGVAQALAIFPGISRSGATIASGMVRGLSRSAATRFSFLMAIPVVAGASVFKLGDLLDRSGDAVFTGPELAVSVLVAGASGYWAIRFLLRLVASEDLTGFARYVVLLAAITFVGTLWLGPVSGVE